MRLAATTVSVMYDNRGKPIYPDCVILTISGLSPEHYKGATTYKISITEAKELAETLTAIYNKYGENNI